MERLTFADKPMLKPWVHSAEAIKRLAAYEDTGLTPEGYKAFADAIRKLDIQHIHDLLAAERDGRLVVLPSRIGSTVYIAEKCCFSCEDCRNKARACYRSDFFRTCCDKFPDECPVQISERIVCGYEINQDNSGNTVLSAPGEWGYKGFEEFSGLDGKWYLTREEAEAALEGENHETDPV